MNKPDRRDDRDVAPAAPASAGSTPPQDEHDRPRSFVRRVLVAAGISLGLAAFALFLWYSVYVILLIFAGVLVAILLRGLADPISSLTGMGHRWALAIVLLAIALLAGGFAWFVAPPLIGQLGSFVERLPAALDSAREQFAGTELGERVLSRVRPDGLWPAGTELLSRATGLAYYLLDAVAALVVVLFTGMFIAFDPKLYVRGALRLLPMEQRHRGGEVVGAIGFTLKWWLIGQAITMVIIATATTIGLWLLGVPLALLLGVVAGLFNFIPNFGPLFSMVPAVLLALGAHGPGTALSVIVLFLVLQNVEGNLLTPLIQRRAVDLPPAVGIVAQILLGILAGPIGLILAWPLAAAVHVAVRMLYVEDVLGDCAVETPADDEGTREVREALEMADEVTEEEPTPETETAIRRDVPHDGDRTARERGAEPGRPGRDATERRDGNDAGGGDATADPAPPRSRGGSR